MPDDKLSDRSGPANGDETPKERRDRELVELLNELRVVLPGVQVLFAFLLAVPFASRFSEVGPFHKGLFVISLIATALAIATLVAPTAFHRARFRQGDKERLIQYGNVLALVGLGLLAVAVVAATLLVTDIVLSRGPALVIAAVVGLVIAVLWVVVPTWAHHNQPETGSHDSVDAR